MVRDSRVLFVCESIDARFSGGKVARYLTELVGGAGVELAIVVVSEPDEAALCDPLFQQVRLFFLPQRDRTRFTVLNIIQKTKGMARFQNILRTFNPEVVHFASFDHTKPPEFIRFAKRYGARVILQPWTMEFYCFTKYGYRERKQCLDCAMGNFFNSMKNGCLPFHSVFTLLKRFRLKRAAKEADIILSSNSGLDKILVKYGIHSKKIVRFPVPYDFRKIRTGARVEGGPSSFVYFGLPIDAKGFWILVDIFRAALDLMLDVYPSTAIYSTFSPNIRIHNGISWSNGLLSAIEGSIAVLVPSVWNTSTEYSLWEAINCGKPVVTFSVGAHRELFPGGKGSLVVEAGDLEGYSQAVRKIATDQTLRSRLVIEGKEQLESINNKDGLVQRLRELYYGEGR